MKRKANGMSGRRTSPLIMLRREHKRLRPNWMWHLQAAAYRHTPPLLARVHTQACWKYCFDRQRPRSLSPQIGCFPGVQQLTEYKGVSFIKLFLGQIFNQFSAHGYNPRLHFVPLQPRGIRGNGQSSATPLSPHIAEKLNAFVFLDAKGDIYLKTCGACEWRSTGFCRLIFWRHRCKNSLEASALRRWTGMAKWIHDGTNLLDYMVQLLGFKSTED